MLVEDHPVVRDGLSLLLGEQPDFRVVGDADDAEAALALIERTRPEVAVVDVTLRGSTAMSLIPQLRQRWPALRILVLSMHEESLYAERLLALGAHGYVMKHEPPAEFLRALRRVAAGDMHVSGAAGERLVARGHRAPAVPLRRGGDTLTGREREVLRLVARGLGTNEISRALALSPKTVDSHRRNIREKLGLSNVRDLVRYAVRWVADQPAEGGQ